MKLFLMAFILFISTSAFSQISNFKMMVGSSEFQIKKDISGFNSTKELYSEGGKTIIYSFRDFDVMYAIKANKVCSKVWIIFHSSTYSSQMDKWFYDNEYNAKKNVNSGEYEWSKTIITKSKKTGKQNNEILVTALKLDETTYFFADKLATLLGY